MNSQPGPILLAGGILGSLLAGSLPTGYLVVKALKGIDIRAFGSGNPGATNVLRAAGKGPALFTLAVDVLKGFSPAWICLRFFPFSPVFASLAGFAAVCGHNWSPFLNCRGGKGVATSIGMFAALLPLPSLIAVACFLVSLAASRMVSLGSIAGALGLTAGAFILEPSLFFRAFAAAASLLVVFLHRKNISGILKGEEPKI